MNLQKIIILIIVLVLFNACGEDSKESNNIENSDRRDNISSTQSEFDGVWKGDGEQTNGTQWTIKITIDSDTQEYKIDYPSISCGGSLKLLSATEDKIEFREKLSYGQSRCIDNGKIVLVKTEQDKADYIWYLENGEREAWGVVERNIDKVDISTNINKGLVAHYKFDGNTKDSSGNENHGEEHGDITYVDGVMGKAINFDGVDDYIRIANNNPDSLKEFTISLYLLPKGNGGAIFNSYSWNWSSNTGKGLLLSLNDEEGSGVIEGTDKDFLWFGVHFDEGWFGNQHKSIKTKLDRNDFLHVCAVYNNGDEKIYIDGKLKASHHVEHKFDLGNYDFLLGTYFIDDATDTVENTDSQTFLGQMDEFRFYNRALNESEITELYQMGL